MAYTRRTWTDRVVEFIRRYRDQNNTQYTFTPDEGTITNPGTPTSAAYMNNIEDGIVEALTGSTIYAASSSGSDAYAVTLTGVITSYTAGLTVRIKADVANTGACTLNVNSLGAKAIKKKVSSDLEDGDIKVGRVITVIYDGTNFQISPEVPRFRKQIFTADGTFTAPQTGVYKVTVVGGGGSSARDASNGVGGGGGGAIVIKTLSLTKDDAVTVTIGAGGVAPAYGTTTNGNAGGTSSFGTHCSATGGSGGYLWVTGVARGGYGGYGSNGDLNLKGNEGSFFAGFNGGNSAIELTSSIYNPYGKGAIAVSSVNNAYGGNAGVVIVEWVEV
ncbi:glycine-rich domain-containing protein [Dehalobacter sp.]|uniref:glycine-rich domain-containing protein n=1 Tax=Dehalobacter sp. TaxID=1962289 RepID=UPI00258E0828|nr:hypothetical protein [Dehalobacter sp.]MDJ0305398.1 hypothetical protein [Dehalobacter sp.]